MVLCFGTAANATVSVTSAYFTYTSTGPSGSTASDNLALASNGATAFAIDDINYTEHKISHLNDGYHGNSYSWIGESSESIYLGGNLGDMGYMNAAYAGIALSTEYYITSFAFGRDNTGTYSDRVNGTYYIQITTDATVDGNSTWTTIGTIEISDDDALRHVYTLTNSILATGLRIIVSDVGSATGTCIDEIEIYGTAVPEPAAFGLLASLLAFGAVVRERRRK